MNREKCGHLSSFPKRIAYGQHIRIPARKRIFYGNRECQDNQDNFIGGWHKHQYASERYGTYTIQSPKMRYGDPHESYRDRINIRYGHRMENGRIRKPL